MRRSVYSRHPSQLYRPTIKYYTRHLMTFCAVHQKVVEGMRISRRDTRQQSKVFSISLTSPASQRQRRRRQLLSLERNKCNETLIMAACLRRRRRDLMEVLGHFEITCLFSLSLSLSYADWK